MKAKRYSITIYDSVLEISHGFGRTISEIRFENGLTVNKEAVFYSDKKRTEGAKDIEDIEVDNLLFDLFMRYENMRLFATEEAKRILALTTTNIKATSQTPIYSWDDFEKRYLPKQREERLLKEETLEQTGERLAKESIARISEDLHKHKFPRRKK